jgi:hypothetical protein
VLEGINKKIIFIVPDPLLGYMVCGVRGLMLGDE